MWTDKAPDKGRSFQPLLIPERPSGGWRMEARMLQLGASESNRDTSLAWIVNTHGFQGPHGDSRKGEGSL